MSVQPITNAVVAKALVVTLDAALDLRVVLHTERAAGSLDVPAYLAGLRAVREIEGELEPLRESGHTRAWERSVPFVDVA